MEPKFCIDAPKVALLPTTLPALPTLPALLGFFSPGSLYSHFYIIFYAFGAFWDIILGPPP